MAIFLTSDMHFGHDREFIWKARGYSSVEEMNEDYIEKWNSIVTKNMSDKEKKELKRLLSMAIENIKEEI